MFGSWYPGAVLTLCLLLFSLHWLIKLVFHNRFLAQTRTLALHSKSWLIAIAIAIVTIAYHLTFTQLPYVLPHLTSELLQLGCLLLIPPLPFQTTCCLTYSVCHARSYKQHFMSVFILSVLSAHIHIFLLISPFLLPLFFGLLPLPLPLPFYFVSVCYISSKTIFNLYWNYQLPSPLFFSLLFFSFNIIFKFRTHFFKLFCALASL